MSRGAEAWAEPPATTPVCPDHHCIPRTVPTRAAWPPGAARKPELPGIRATDVNGQRQRGWGLLVGGLALLTGCANTGVVCNASCQIPIQISFVARGIAVGDTLRVCLSGQGCTSFPVIRDTGRPSTNGRRPLTVNGIPLEHGRGAIAMNLPLRAYHVTATLSRGHRSGAAARQFASTRLQVHGSTQAPCACPSATGTLQFQRMVHSGPRASEDGS